MNISKFVFLLFCLQCLYWCVGRYASRNLKSKEDYFLAGKSVRFFPLMMTFLASQVGGGLVLGAAEEAYRFGWPVLLYPLGAALGLILLGSGIGKRLARYPVSTVAQIFEIFYQSHTLKKVASLLSIISLFMILVAQIIASHKFLISLGFNHPLLFIIFWAIVIFYTSRGGLKALISVDIVQASFFTVVFLLALGVVLYLEPAVTQLHLPHLEDFTSISSKWCGWLLMPLLFMVIEQDMGQRCFAGASPSAVSKACCWAGIVTLVVCFVPVFIGSLAHTAHLEIPQGGSVLLVSIEQMTNPWLTACVGCAIIAAILATATSLINAISSNLSNDFAFAKTKGLAAVKSLTCLISAAAIFFSFYFDNIVDLLIQSYDLSVSCLFAPLALALFKKKGNFLAAWVAILAGALSFILLRIFPLPFPREILSVGFSFLGYSCGQLLARYQMSSVPLNYPSNRS